ncbi:MAG: hypothetical protein U5Q44_07045 [Dehalococcoidia bacterium]|nr:hypothetical protein [Dehalococcoidia bacterium]
MRWITATAHIDIARQRQDVWNFVAEPANMDAWVNGVSGAHLTGAGLMGPGAKNREQVHLQRPDLRHRIRSDGV